MCSGNLFYVDLVVLYNCQKPLYTSFSFMGFSVFAPLLIVTALNAVCGCTLVMLLFES